MCPDQARGDSSNGMLVLLDAAPNPVLGVDVEGHIDYVNDQAVLAFGYARRELIGKPVEILVPDELAVSHVRHRGVFAGDPHARVMGEGPTLSAVRKDGSRFQVEISLIPVELDTGSWVVASVLDVTDRRRDEANMRELSRAYLTLARMNQAIVRAPDQAALYEETCRIAVDVGGYLGVWVGEANPAGSIVCEASAGELDDYIAQIHATTDPGDPHGLGPTGSALRDGRTVYLTDFLADEATRPWHAQAALHGIAAVASLPLRLRGQTVAVLTFYSRDVEVFSDQVRTMLEGMADNVSFALHSFDATSRLREVARDRSELLAHLVGAQEVERTRIAADVHDESVQALAAVHLRLGVLRRRLHESAPEFEPEVAKVQETLDFVSAGLRDLLFELEAADEAFTLPQLARSAAAYLFDGSEVTYTVVTAADFLARTHALSDTVRGQALRIIKEALINVHKHAEASSVEVLMIPGPDGLEVQISDDGTGFESDLTTLPGHRGMSSMRERAAVSGGWCLVEARNPGTRVRFWVPYEGVGAA